VPVNWRTGAYAMAASFCMATAGISYNSPLSVAAAALTSIYGLFVPLRLLSCLFSLAFARLLRQISIRVIPVIGTMYVIGVAANSRAPAIGTLASLGFIVVLAGVGAVAVRYTSCNARRSGQALGRFLQGALAGIAVQFRWVRLCISAD
jgi:hypothetical protein